MIHAVRVHEPGGPEVLRYEPVPLPEPGPGQVQLRHEAIGLNFIDVYFRTGLYKLPGLPAVIGQEGAGIVTAIGPDVVEFAPGDRVAYAGALGAYATHRVVAADRLVPVPESIGSRLAAAFMLQGLTAHYLLHRTFRVQAGQTILVHAAAGGVGLLLCQWASHMGATVVGVVSSEAKAAIARANGAAHIIVGHATLAADVKRLTQGAMAPVVYDSVGRDTFFASLDSLAPQGLLVSYGNSSGPVPPFELSALSARGSLFVTRPTLATHTARRADLLRMWGDLVCAVEAGVLRPQVNQEFPLAEAAAAHRALESRQTTGSTILVP